MSRRLPGFDSLSIEPRGGLCRKTGKLLLDGRTGILKPDQPGPRIVRRQIGLQEANGALHTGMWRNNDAGNFQFPSEP